MTTRARPEEEAKPVSVVYIDDPTAVGDSVELIDQDIISLDAGSFQAKRIMVLLADCGLMYQWTNAGLRTRTRIHDGLDACTVLGPNAQGSIDGMELQPYTMMLAGPGADAEIIVDAGYESITLLVPPRVLDQHLVLRKGTRSFSMPAGVEVRHPAVAKSIAHFETGARICSVAERAPDVFTYSHAARIDAQVEVIDSLLATIESCDPDESLDTDAKGRSYSAMVKACEDYTLSLDDRRPYMSELCATANASERTLQYAFGEIMGMSPITYLLRLRLHRARQELRGAPTGAKTVTEIAMNWGFWHLGEFSKAYKECFGESPSATLRNGAGD